MERINLDPLTVLSKYPAILGLMNKSKEKSDQGTSHVFKTRIQYQGQSHKLSFVWEWTDDMLQIKNIDIQKIKDLYSKD